MMKFKTSKTLIRKTGNAMLSKRNTSERTKYNTQPNTMGNMNSNERTRLDRIEEKIDKMADAIIALARAEEKITTLDDTTRIILKRMVAQDDRLRNVEQLQADTEGTLKTIKSITWTFVSAVVTGLAGAVLWMIGLPAGD